MTFAVEACRLFLSIRLGRWEFFVQPKSSPGYDAYHDRRPFAFFVSRSNAGDFMEATVEIPFLALSWVDHRL